MVTLSLATAENRLPLFIKSLIENNVTDPVSSKRSGKNLFVYKDAPETLADVYPYIVVESESSENEYPTLDSSLRRSLPYTIVIDVFSKGANCLQHRDQLTDEIMEVLSDRSMTDKDGDSMVSNLLFPNEMRTTKADYSLEDGKVIRNKEITLEVEYAGS